MKVRKTKRQQQNSSGGSALVLAVILTGMLAMVGMLFVIAGRVEKMATSSISDEKDLNLAVDTVIARVEELLILDVERSSNSYYDYPDVNNRWLASLEPALDGAGDPCWPQVSNIYGPPISLSVAATVVGDSGLDAAPGGPADADGDGVSDSMWVELLDMSSSRARPIYAAVRVIDNAAMLNANTAYKFNPTAELERIDGSSLLQINLMALSWRLGSTDYDSTQEDELLLARSYIDPAFGAGEENLDRYEEMVIWSFTNPYYVFTPFDISDELEMRNRFVLNHDAIHTRLESWGRGQFYVRGQGVNWTPFEDRDEWFRTAYDDGSLTQDYAYRHLVTTYNMDRIIAPDGARMVNVNGVNEPNVADLYQAIQKGLVKGGVPEGPSCDLLAGQMAVNIKDFRDNDSNVSAFDIPPADNSYDVFGFERPCIYISELVHNYEEGAEGQQYNAYYIELCKPYPYDGPARNWRLVTRDRTPPYPLKRQFPTDWTGISQFHVIRAGDEQALMDINCSEPNDCDPNDPNDPNCEPSNRTTCGGVALEPNETLFDAGDTIELQRPVPGGGYVVVDSVQVPPWLIRQEVGARSFQRDIDRHKCIRRLWAPGNLPDTLGDPDGNGYQSGDSIYIQAHPYLDSAVYGDKGFKNVGEIGKVFAKAAYYKYQVGADPVALPADLHVIGYSEHADTEPEIFINLGDSRFQRIFNYLTVFDPAADGINNDGDRDAGGNEIIDEYDLDADGYPEPGDELKVPGRININTAPWYVLAQLPWMTPEIAVQIINNRNGVQPFESIGELMRIPQIFIGFYASSRSPGDQRVSPDLTPGDGAPDDFEERDLIFARISNLVTVRSDVFTAYILVRIGADGPQKRAIAIFDRSDVYPDGSGGTIGRVRLRAIHPVHDPR